MRNTAFKGILILATWTAAVAAACGTASGPGQAPNGSDADSPTPLAASATPSPVAAQDQTGLDPDINRQKVTRAIRYSRPSGGDKKVRVLEIVDVAPRDAIKAIDNPLFIKAAEASGQLASTDQVIGLSINGQHKAYSTAFLSSHEIVNDVVGGKPVAVTW